MILTDNNLADPHELEGISIGFNLLFQEAEADADKIPEGAELVIDFRRKEQQVTYRYYFAHVKLDNTSGVVFWKEDTKVEDIVDGFIHNVCSLSHLGQSALWLNDTPLTERL